MSPEPRLAPAVLVHGLGDARTAVGSAFALGVPVTLLSAPAASAHAGALWFLEVASLATADFPGALATAVLDCADRAGDALGAITAGITHLVFTGRADVAARLDDIACGNGAVVLTRRPPALDLRGARDAAATCRAWLTGPAGLG